MAAKTQEREHLRVYIRGYVREYVDGEELDDSGFADNDGALEMNFDSPRASRQGQTTPPHTSPTSSPKQTMATLLKEVEGQVLISQQQSANFSTQLERAQETFQEKLQTLLQRVEDVEDKQARSISPQLSSSSSGGHNQLLMAQLRHAQEKIKTVEKNIEVRPSKHFPSLFPHIQTPNPC